MHDMNTLTALLAALTKAAPPPAGALQADGVTLAWTPRGVQAHADEVHVDLDATTARRASLQLTRAAEAQRPGWFGRLIGRQPQRVDWLVVELRAAQARLHLRAPLPDAAPLLEALPEGALEGAPLAPDQLAAWLTALLNLGAGVVQRREAPGSKLEPPTHVPAPPESTWAPPDDATSAADAAPAPGPPPRAASPTPAPRLRGQLVPGGDADAPVRPEDQPRLDALLALAAAPGAGLGEGTWRALCGALEDWKAPGVLRVARALAEVVATWPDPDLPDEDSDGVSDDVEDEDDTPGPCARRAPDHWLTAAAEGAPPAGLLLAAEAHASYARFKAPGARDLARCPLLTGLRVLYLHDNDLGDEGVSALAASPHLTGLRQLTLSGQKLSAAGVAALARAPWTPHLTRLSLWSNAIDASGAAALAAAPLTGLRRLGLGHNPLGDAGVGALADAPWLAGLERLDLTATEVTGDGLLRLLAADPSALTDLDLSANPLRPHALQALGAAPHLARLTTLDLSEVALGDHLDAFVEALGRAHPQGLSRLRHLTLERCRLDAPRLARLVDAHLLSGLTQLTLGGNPLDDAALTALSRADLGSLRYLSLGVDWLRDEEDDNEADDATDDAPRFTPQRLGTLLESLRVPRLHGGLGLSHLRLGDGLIAALASAPTALFLSLEDNRLSPDGARALSRLSWLGEVHGLSLGDNPLGDAGVAALLGDGLRLPKLDVLDLSDCQLGDAALTLLAERLDAPRLSALFLSENDLGPDGARALARAPWHATLETLSLWGNDRFAPRGVETLLAAPHLSPTLALDLRARLDA